MEFRQLNALLAVSEHGSFSAAADALHTVQSNISAHVARLEKELGVTLVNRANGGLTPEGDVVIRRARRIHTEVEAVTADVAALRDEVIGEVRIGLIGTTARWLVPEVMGVMNERYPLTQMRVSEGTTSVLEPQLVSGALDLAVVLLPMPAPDINTDPLFEEDMLLVVDRDHEHANREEISMTELADIPLLLPPAGTPQRAELDEAASAAGAKLRVKAEVDGVRLTASLVFDGHGPSVMPATSLPGYLRDRWRLITVAGLPRRRVALAQPRRSFPTPPARALRGVLREVISRTADFHPGIHFPQT